ncbi:DUF547 domain-containing protein [Bizionia sediminis]|uniref:DUF547 domain-containing protein n=1 Tax=Bizionia sediminis TaxID=1737064 RepID=A0ABW5KRL5_9FLAO
MTKISGIYLLLFALCLCTSLRAQTVNHAYFSEFLQQYVSPEGQVNYQAISANSAALNTYLNDFVKVAPQENWSKNDTLAYWINAYNAFTLKLIINNYPLKSIKDIKNPWDIQFIPINGKLWSLNDIEHNVLRKMNEPRIHFAIVCASASCPKLLNEAYMPNKMEAQLTKVTKQFLSDTTKNSIATNHLKLSKIFKWFAADFKENGSLIPFINRYTNENISEQATISYQNYSWDLNGQ